MITNPGAFADNFDRWIYLLFNGKFNLIYQAYFKADFNWEKIDRSLVAKLNNVLPRDNEGCLLDALGDLRVRTQVNFLASIMKKTKAKRIIETGTHKAMFCYIAYLCNELVTIDTFGDLPGSQKAVEILNQAYGRYISFHMGDSRQTLSNFFPSYQVDFAWIDGGHSFEVCSSDLANCARLKVPSIAVDDYKWVDTVQRAVGEFIERYEYSVAGRSNSADYREIVHLQKDL